MGSWRFGTSEGKWNEYLMFCVICNFCVVSVSRCKQWSDIASRVLFALSLTLRIVQSLSSEKCWGLCIGPDKKALSSFYVAGIDGTRAAVNAVGHPVCAHRKWERGTCFGMQG